MAVSFKYYPKKQSSIAIGSTKRGSGRIIDLTLINMRRRKENKKYPKGTQVLKQLVSSRNSQKYWADPLTAQTPCCKNRKDQ